jgi:uncharacterized membrane protein
MKIFRYVGAGLLSSVLLTAGLFGHAAGTVFTAFLLGPFVMGGFFVASMFSDGVVPAFGYGTSVSLTFILLLVQRSREITRKGE